MQNGQVVLTANPNRYLLVKGKDDAQLPVSDIALKNAQIKLVYDAGLKDPSVLHNFGCGVVITGEQHHNYAETAELEFREIRFDGAWFLFVDNQARVPSDMTFPYLYADRHGISVAMA